MKLKNLNGNKNQFVVSVDGKKYFQSYESIMVMIDEYGKLYVSTDKENYTTTTAKYMKRFLEQHGKEYNRSEIFKAIDEDKNEKRTVNSDILIEIK